MDFLENIKVALASIRTNLMRTVITCLIISVGIMALVGILTAIDGIKSSISQNFSSMGANTFSIRNSVNNFRVRGRGDQAENPLISYREAIAFKEKFDNVNVVSVSLNASMGATAAYKSEKTNPNVTVIGMDDNYLQTAGYVVEQGRNFSNTELSFGSDVALIGKEIKENLFKNNEDPIGKTISISGTRYKIVGLLKSKGSSLAMSGDRVVYIPIVNARKHFGSPNANYIINVAVPSVEVIDDAIYEAVGQFRQVRELRLSEDNDFGIQKSDSLANKLIDFIGIITLSAIVIAFITLLGAAVGLMNIMLVSVTERTREIGTRKALGAKVSTIRKQFLFEAVVVCVLGGLGGIILGIAMGNGVSILVGGGFIIPWAWITLGITICVVVGLTAGLYPAIKASKLDPIEALRFE